MKRKGTSSLRGRMEPLQFENKTEALRKALMALAHELGAGGRLPAMRDMCRSFGVSTVTLDRALHDLETRNLVLRKHGVGVFVSPEYGRKTIGLVFGRNIFDEGVSPVCRLLFQYCRQRAAECREGFRVYFDLPAGPADPATASGRNDLVRDVAEGRVQGLLLIWRQGAEEEAWLRSLGVPLVSFVTGLPLSAPYQVTLDYADMTRRGVAALAGAGCRRLALISPFGYVHDADIDRTVFLEAVAAQGLETRPEWLWDNPADPSVGLGAAGESREEQGNRALREILGRPVAGRPDGVLINDDMLARGALVAARVLGLTLGRDLHIATHANKGSPVLYGHEDELIRLVADPDEIVRAMFEVLEPLMAGAEPATESVAVRATVTSAGDRMKPRPEAMELAKV